MNRRKPTVRLAAWLFCTSFLIVLFASLTLSFVQNVSAEEAEHPTIRIGYYPTANYQETRTDGSYTGFGYDYFMQIQKYTRWDYEFVQASYSECLQMLEDGKLDVVGGIGMTAEREQSMIFSKYSVFSSQNELYARLDNETMFYESYDTFDGCSIGIIKGKNTTELDEYCIEHEFSAEYVVYETETDMEAALTDGEVDLIWTASVSNSIQTKIVARMDKVPLYYATSIDKPEIAEQLDDALQKIVDNNPNFYTQMSEKYMLGGASATATFTREEFAYINSGQTVYVIVNRDWAPITWYDKESGSYKGIVVDMLERIKEYSGLTFEICTEEQYETLVAENPDIEQHVLAVLADDNNWAVEQNVLMTNHIVDSSVVMVTNRGIDQTDLTHDMKIALPDRFYISHMLRSILSDKAVTYYDTVEDCLNAVNSGKADATYVNELVATYYLSKLEYSKLFATANSGFYENLAFAVNKDSAAPLLSILDKSLLCIGTSDVEQIITQNTIANQRFSIRGLYYSNPTFMIGMTVAVVVIFCLIGLSVYVAMARKRRAEQELLRESETNNARTEFFMMISHELRTPLNAIVGYLNLVAEQCEKNCGEMEYIRRSQKAAKQLTDIAEDMLDYTRVASDTVELHEEIFDLKEVITDVDQSVSIRAAQKNQNYRFTAYQMTREYIVGDKLRVTQIMQNLLSNAVKFTDEGGTIEAEVKEQVAEDGTISLIFICRDTGKGMTEEFLEEVCAPFSQSDCAYSRTHGGLGLGLYLTRYFVTVMKGDMKLESKLGEGSCFTVTLPLRQPDGAQVLENKINCSHVRAAIAGTNMEDIRQLADLLKRLKIKSDLFTDSNKLVKRIRSRAKGEYAYSLCILDETMVGGEAAVLETVSQLEGAPTIFVSTANTQQINQFDADERVERVLYKPIFQSVLFDAVMNTFGEYKVEETEDSRVDLSGLHILIVEDNTVNADILTRVLKKTHAVITCCENGKLAVEEYERNNEIEMILMDIQMPVMDGYEATRQIRASKRANAAEIPIVAVSANAFAEDIQKSIEAGMNEHLSKPIDAKKLYTTIQKYCNSNKMPQHMSGENAEGEK